VGSRCSAPISGGFFYCPDEPFPAKEQITTAPLPKSDPVCGSEGGAFLSTRRIAAKLNLQKSARNSALAAHLRTYEPRAQSGEDQEFDRVS
jgi:hypothetical protein